MVNILIMLMWTLMVCTVICFHASNFEHFFKMHYNNLHALRSFIIVFFNPSIHLIRSLLITLLTSLLLFDEVFAPNFSGSCSYCLMIDISLLQLKGQHTASQGSFHVDGDDTSRLVAVSMKHLSAQLATL